MTPAFDLAPLTHLSASIAALAAAGAPSMVSVRSHRALCSGFVWKPGLIVTADEALAEEGEVAITLAGGPQIPAVVAGRDPTTDIALIRADTGEAPPLALDRPPPPAGALVLALGGHDGHPLAAFGMVAMSGPGWRSLRGGEIDARIELDVSLRREAEGGVAFDADGRAFGLTVFGPRRRVLVIPSATLGRVAAQLEGRGKVSRGYLGLGLQAVRLGPEGGRGVMVMSVDPDGPAAKVGLHQGDVITAWDGHPVRSLGALLRSLGPDSVGTTVVLTLQRAGDSRTVDLVVGERT